MKSAWIVVTNQAEDTLDSGMCRRVGSILVILAAAALALRAQTGDGWRDPSPHQRRFVTVDSNVRLEVLDWGGSGRPVVFVGCYLTGHVYDDIAPKIGDRFRVYAITRRGIGASDHAPSGYAPQRRADDVLEVIAALKMERPILVGSSCGGDILHTLGAGYPDLIGGLMYLDGAEDPTLTRSDYGPAFEFDMSRLPPRVGTQEPTPFPEAERRQHAQFPLDAAIRRAIVEDNRVRPPYAQIKVPVVAIYRTMTMEQVLKQYPPRNEQDRQALKEGYAAGRAMLSKWQSDLLAGVPNARIVELPGAELYMFLSNEADIVRELRSFGEALDNGTPR
jgi:pimeloyl-ACP methyl ester carboxylesterase